MFTKFCYNKIHPCIEIVVNLNDDPFLQSMASGEGGQRCLDVHVLVVEVQSIDNGCVIIRARVSVAAGVLEI